MRTLLSLAIVGSLALPASAADTTVVVDTPSKNQPFSQPADQSGVGVRVGESVDRGLTNIGQRLRKTWADFRRSVDELSVQGRVYGRFHWDKAIGSAPIEISVQNENIVTLSGSVPSETARQVAVALANNTVGVGQVIDKLTVVPTTTLPTTTTAEPTSSTTTPAVPPVAAPQR